MRSDDLRRPQSSRSLHAQGRQRETTSGTSGTVRPKTTRTNLSRSRARGTTTRSQQHKTAETNPTDGHRTSTRSRSSSCGLIKQENQAKTKPHKTKRCGVAAEVSRGVEDVDLDWADGWCCYLPPGDNRIEGSRTIHVSSHLARNTSMRLGINGRQYHSHLNTFPQTASRPPALS